MTDANCNVKIQNMTMYGHRKEALPAYLIAEVRQPLTH